MVDVLRLVTSRSRARLRLDPIAFLLRLDATYRERRKLDELTPAQLDDIGLTRADVERFLGR